MACISKADNDFYKQSNLILEFCRNSLEFFSKKNNLPDNRYELDESQTGIKKEPSKKALNLNGGNDEARTRDLMRDRHAL